MSVLYYIFRYPYFSLSQHLFPCFVIWHREIRFLFLFFWSQIRTMLVFEKRNQQTGEHSTTV